MQPGQVFPCCQNGREIQFAADQRRICLAITLILFVSVLLQAKLRGEVFTDADMRMPCLESYQGKDAAHDAE